MNRDMFEKLLDELDGNSVNTLKEKNARYSSPNDCLHNFNTGGDIFGGTAAEACWGYLTKHLVALRDMVKRNDFSNRDDFLEKCQDAINYIRFLWCIGNEECEKHQTESTENDSEPHIGTGDKDVYMTIDFNSYKKASSVLQNITDIYQEFGEVFLADIHEIVGVAVKHEDTKIAWTSLRNMKITDDLANKKFTLNLPKPNIIDIKKEND